MTLEYRQSLKELNNILNIMGIEYINKLPNKLTNFIKDNMDNTYVSSININIPINEQVLKKDTKILLSLIYRNYWCEKEVKKKLMEEDNLLKNSYAKKYNPDNLFKKTTQSELVKENVQASDVAMVEYKESFIKRIVNKIKQIFS